MTTALTREVTAVQSPALGATLLWRFAVGYMEVHERPAPVQLFFLPLPMLYRQEFVHVITGISRRAAGIRKASGLRAVADALREAKNAKQDLLLTLHDELLDLRQLTLASLRIAIASRLLTLDDRGNVWVVRREPIPTTTPERVRRLVFGAEKLGFWCGSLTLYEIAATLHIAF